MATITDENKGFWQQLAKDLGAAAPMPGKLIKVIDGRKHKGKTGTVLRNQLDKYRDAYRYGNEASHHLKDMARKSGYVCLVRESGTNNEFWVRADYCEVIAG